MTTTNATSTTPIAGSIAGTPKTLLSAAHFFSFVLSPLLAPFYGFAAAWATTVLRLLPGRAMLSISLVVLGLTCLFPMIAIALMWKMKIVSDPGLNRRRERTLPFLASAAGYVACLVFMMHINAPRWLVMFVVGGILALVVALAVNTRWKISVHLTGMGGVMALMYFLYAHSLCLFAGEAWLIAAILACGFVGTSRLILGRHTPLQVAAGTLNGCLCVWLSLIIGC